MRSDAGNVTIPALPPAAGLPQVGADEKTSKPTEVKSAVRRAVLVATRRRRRGFEWG